MRPADATRLPEGRAVTVPLAICRGVKSDPIEYRYSYEWLFRLMAEEGAPCLQLGSFFELYRLPDKWFLELREQAERYGIAIRSAFTAHRELGGFFRDEPGWESVARRSYERLIEVAALVGARHVGSNPGAVLRDQMHLKPQGIARYLRHMKELMHFAHARGIERLTIEPMSCLAEPPTLPEEIRDMAEELSAFHRDHPDTADFGYCADVSHGYADRDGKSAIRTLNSWRRPSPTSSSCTSRTRTRSTTRPSASPRPSANAGSSICRRFATICRPTPHAFR
jgi:hypothetical protein